MIVQVQHQALKSILTAVPMPKMHRMVAVEAAATEVAVEALIQTMTV